VLTRSFQSVDFGAAAIFGGLGALNDVVISQAVTVVLSGEDVAVGIVRTVVRGTSAFAALRVLS
jgi:hypothetical protein